MQSLPNKLPPLPEIGYPEAYYAKRVKQADLAGDAHTREAYKVGQYVTLAMQPHLPWDQKLKYFRHAIRRHCNPPPLPTDEVWLFYQGLADLVRQHAGKEALRLALTEDERLARRVAEGVRPEFLEGDAEKFFGRLLPRQEACPEYFTHEDWDQLRLVRNQWI